MVEADSGRGQGSIEFHTLRKAESGKGVIIVCEEEKTGALSARLSDLPGCPEHLLYNREQQAPTDWAPDRVLGFLTNDKVRIKLLSQAAFFCRPPSWRDRNEWNLIYEIPNKRSLALPISATFPDDHNLILRHVLIIPTDSPFGTVVIDEFSEFERGARHIHGDIGELLCVLGNGYHETQVNMEHYREALEGKRQQATFYSRRLHSAVINGFMSAKILPAE